MTKVPDLQGRLGPLEIPHCRRCGKQVEFRHQKTTGYSPTGVPIIELRYDCPRRGFLPWGRHARRYFYTGIGWAPTED